MTAVKITMLNSMAGTDIIQALDNHVAWDLKVLDLKGSIFGKSVTEITDEEAECYYNLKRCYFDIDNLNISISMTTAYSTEHSAEWDDDKTYHVKCRDIWGNENAGCGIRVKPSSLS